MKLDKEELKEFFEMQKGIFGERVFNKNNKVVVKGILTEDFTFSHERWGIKYYKNVIKVQRLSQNFDNIPLLVSEKYLDLETNIAGKVVDIRGSFRSCNDIPGHLKLYLYVKSLSTCGEVEEKENNNHIYLDGYICKEIKYRITPSGREICDLLLAVNRAMGNTDYIPCIAWGINAREIDCLKIGNRIRIYGRIQSRKYEKAIEGSESGEKVKKEVNEVSIVEYEVVE